MTPEDVLAEFVALVQAHDAHVREGRWFWGQCLLCNPESIDQFEDKIRVLVAEAARLRQRHAEAVEAAFREGLDTDSEFYIREAVEAGDADTLNGPLSCEDLAWLASEAKARLT